MTTRELGADLPAVTPPGEIRPHLGQLSKPGDTPSTPSLGGTSPGVSLGAARLPPTAPTLPEMDPTSMTLLVSRLANELFAAPPAPDGAMPDDVSSTPTTTGGAPVMIAAPGAPSTSLAPIAPSVPAAAPTFEPAPLLTAASPAAAPSSPFDAPLDFGALGAVSDPFGAPMSLPLLDTSPEAPAVGVPAPSPFSLDAFQVEPAVDLGLPRSSGPLDPHALKRQFPILRETVNGRPLVWLDNGATTQKPKAVIDRLTYFYEHENSNIHRAAHTLAARATEAYEKARESVRRFLKASSTREIVFVRGATEGINFVAQSWGRRNVKAGDEIVISWLEHHANIVPWQMLAAETGATLRVAPVDDRGQVILEEYEKLLGPKTRIVAFTAVSNALGTITPAKQMVELAHRHGARVLVDGAQAVSHMPVDVQSLDCDFYVFSGHKVFAPTGIGAVYGKLDVLEATPPWQGGGNMIQDVTFERTVYHGPPARFEAGTGNIADAVGLGAALDWLTQVGIENVERYEHELLLYGAEQLKTVPGLTMIGTAPNKAGVMSFILAGQKTEEVGGMLDREGIAVRSGHHCAQPILRRFGVEATVRASLAPYNTREDLDALTAALHRIQAGRATQR